MTDGRISGLTDDKSVVGQSGRELSASIIVGASWSAPSRYHRELCGPSPSGASPRAGNTVSPKVAWARQFLPPPLGDNARVAPKQGQHEQGILERTEDSMTTTQTTAPTVLNDLLDNRWSCRGFLPDPVPRGVIEQVLDMARKTPSWCNTQPWHTIVTTGEGTERFRDALTGHAASTNRVESHFEFPALYDGIYQQRRRECGIALYESVGVARGDRLASAREALRNFSFFEAPHTAVITTPADLRVYGAIDCGLYVQTFLLAAQSLGLGAVPQAALAAHSDFVRDHFGLGENRRIVCGISFGYPDLEHEANGFRTSRANLDDTFEWVDA